MFQTQLRFVQIILTFSIFAGLLLRNTPLLISALVGLVLVWQLEMLTGQLRIDTNEYLLTIIFISLTFFPVIFKEVEFFGTQTVYHIPKGIQYPYFLPFFCQKKRNITKKAMKTSQM